MKESPNGSGDDRWLSSVKMVIRRQQQGKRKKQKRKVAWRCVEVTWVGEIARSGEHIVIKHNGDAFKCRTIKRVPVEHQWSAERIMQVRGTPRNPAPSMKNSHQRESRLVDDEAAETRGPRRPKLEKGVIQTESRHSGAGLELPKGRSDEGSSR